MSQQDENRVPTRRKALQSLAAVGGLTAAGGLAAPALLPKPAAAAPGDQLIVAVSATPVSLDPEFGASLESWELPVPATYLIGPDRRISLAYVEVDYRKRLEPNRMLDALRSLQSPKRWRRTG